MHDVSDCLCGSMQCKEAKPEYDCTWSLLVSVRLAPNMCPCACQMHSQITIDSRALSRPALRHFMCQLLVSAKALYARRWHQAALHLEDTHQQSMHCNAQHMMAEPMTTDYIKTRHAQSTSGTPPAQPQPPQTLGIRVCTRAAPRPG